MSGVESSLEQHPLDSLPEEVWRIVFDKLATQDVCNCYKVCTTFEDLLYSRRVSFLFSQVLPFLQSYLLGGDGITQSPLERRRNFLNCRLVCRWWRQSLDDLCESLHFYNAITQQPSLSNFLIYTFKTGASVQAFLEKMRARPEPDSNPFLSRSVKFSEERRIVVLPGQEPPEDPQEDPQTLWESFSSIPSSFGGHISHCEIIVKSEFPLDFLYEQLLVRFSRLMPNLKVLTFSKQFATWGNFNSANNRILEDSLRRSPLPHQTFGNLLQVDFSHLTSALTRHLLQSCDPEKLERLAVISEFDFPQELLRFQSLKCVNFRLHEASTLELLQNVEWPLEEAKLSVRVDEESSKINLSALSEWLNKFGGTLRKLHLILSPISSRSREYVGKELDLRLSLPKAKEVRIYINLRGGLYSIVESLEEMKNVEKFELEMAQCSFNDDKQKKPKEGIERSIEFPGNGPELLYSNVWSVCKKLKYVSLRDSRRWYKYVWNGTPGSSKAERYI